MKVTVALSGDVFGNSTEVDLDWLNENRESFLKEHPNAEVVYNTTEFELFKEKTQFPIAVING